MSVKQHKPDCSCPFCKNIRAKVLREAGGNIPVAPAEPVVSQEAVEQPPVVETISKKKSLFHKIFGEPKTRPEKSIPAAPAVKTVESGKWSRSWYYFLGGIVGIILGLMLVFSGNAVKNPLIIVLGAAIAVAGGFSFKFGFDAHTIRQVKKNGKKRDPNAKPPNCINIYDDRLVLEYSDSPKGIEHKLLNDGKFYYVHVKGLDGNGGTEALSLPSTTQYLDPREALNVIRMTPVKEYLNYSPGNNTPVNLIILTVVIIVESIAIIAIG